MIETDHSFLAVLKDSCKAPGLMVSMFPLTTVVMWYSIQKSTIGFACVNLSPETSGPKIFVRSTRFSD
ncbi:hypothetical protein A8926_2189 [Saccharopolyspora spinosa]|uniref:Uncharacterized protein n=1 Tax=Saccharopolyspora spinosa TaxID=60894 RepID=A0A2N3XV63_SACSN|nr:hypothetical protein A8926_2189 [Saccharopolyspora spinosa]